MPKTTEKQCGDKVFQIRAKVPLQLMDWTQRQNVSDDIKQWMTLPENEKKDFMLGLSSEKQNEIFDYQQHMRNYIAERMIIEPKITKEYLENDADEDDLECFMDLMLLVTGRIKERYSNLKKSPSIGPASQLNPEGRLGLKNIPKN